jgi:Holliday junction DNA helicase RuvA
MIAKLTGLLDTVNENSLILDVGGVGYFVSCSTRTLGNVGTKGDPITLYIETVMRQESLQLYGFENQEEQACFRLLVTVQGVGVRMALAILSSFSSTDVYQAIAAQDKALLTRAEGVGPKLASRIVTELKDKVPQDMAIGVSFSVPPSSLTPLVEEAISALVNLGYRRMEALTAVTKASHQDNSAASLNELIRQGLAFLSRRSA